MRTKCIAYEGNMAMYGIRTLALVCMLVCEWEEHNLDTLKHYRKVYIILMSIYGFFVGWFKL